MQTRSMTQSHQRGASAPWQWPLASNRATRVAAAPFGRWLQVDSGRVWLTRSGAGPHGDDVWLDAGQRLQLPAGSEWVVEGWPDAAVSLLEAPAPRAAFSAAAWSWLRSLAPSLLRAA